MNKGRGFTLVEMLLYLGVLSLIILAVSSLFILFLQARAKNQTIGEVEQQGVQVMQIVTQTIRNTKTINSPAQGQTAAFLSLKVDAMAADPTIFDLSEGVIRITEGVQTPISLTSPYLTASDLSFVNLSRAVKIQFTLSYTDPGGRSAYNYAKTFYGSAKTRP